MIERGASTPPSDVGPLPPEAWENRRSSMIGERYHLFPFVMTNRSTNLCIAFRFSAELRLGSDKPDIGIMNPEVSRYKIKVFYLFFMGKF